MRQSTLATLGLTEHVDSVVGTALLARAMAMQLRTSEGPSAQMEDLATLSVGSMALIDVDVTRRAVTGLALTLTSALSGLSAVASAIAARFGYHSVGSMLFQGDPNSLFQAAAPLDWVVFNSLGQVLWDTRLQYRFYENGASAVIGRDDGQPVGRLGISAYRWMRLLEIPPGPELSGAASWILEHGSAEVERAMRDTFHWRNIHTGLAPIEMELLLAGLIFVGSVTQQESYEVEESSVGRPVVRAVLSVAADMLGQGSLAEEFGGPIVGIDGMAGRRWYHWLQTVNEGPLRW